MRRVMGTVGLHEHEGCEEYYEYVIKRTLNHLPKTILAADDVFDSYLLHSNWVTAESSHDDFYNRAPHWNELFKQRQKFIVVLDGVFHDYTFDEVERFVVKWLVRLNKRLWINAVCVRVWDEEDDRRSLTISSNIEQGYFGHYGSQEIQDKRAWYRLITADRDHFVDEWNRYYCGVESDGEEEQVSESR